MFRKNNFIEINYILRRVQSSDGMSSININKQNINNSFFMFINIYDIIMITNPLSVEDSDFKYHIIVMKNNTQIVINKKEHTRLLKKLKLKKYV